MPPPSIDLAVINDATFITLDVWDRALLKDLATLTDRIKAVDQNTITNNTFAYMQKITTRLREIQAIHRVASRHMMQRIDRLEAIIVVGMSDEQQEVLQQFARNSHESESAVNEQATHEPTPEDNDRIDLSVGSPRSNRTDKLSMKAISESNQQGGRLPLIQGTEVDDRYMMSGALQDL